MASHHTLAAVLAASASLVLAPSLSAQDECTGAIPVNLGANGPFSNVGMTTSTPGFSCVASGGADMWFSYTPTASGTLTASLCGADYDSCMEAYDGSAGCGSLTSVACNDDFCTLQSQVSFSVTSGVTYYIRVGGYSSATGNFPLDLSFVYDFFIEGVAEAAPNTGTLSQGDQNFVDGDFLRWNYSDPLSTFPGQFAATGLNFGAGPQTVGVTAGIPGLELLWAGSTPAGIAFILPPSTVGSPDYVMAIPSGIFGIGDTIRIQGVVLDPVRALGSLPVVATQNTITFTRGAGACTTTEDFEGTTNGVGNYPAGWSDGGGTLMWVADSGGTPSGGTGPSAAVSGTQYMYCETSFPATTGDTWIMNSPVYNSAIDIPNNAISFQLSRVGDAIGTLEVRMDDGSNTFATVVGTFSGMGVNEWDEVILPLGSSLPANVQFQFHYTYGGGFRGDLAIDDFCTH